MVLSLMSQTPSLPGQLFLYAAGRVAFESPPRLIPETAEAPCRTKERHHKCILLGGLSDGLWPVPYTMSLYETAILPNKEWSLVQPVLSSSYTGFGHGSLDRDTRELDELFDYLVQKEHQQHPKEASTGEINLAMIGHSTGCQNAIHYLKHGKHRDRVKVVALQAPVSDREHAQLEHDYETNLQIAKALRDEGRPDEMMPRSAFWAPITASRFLDLQEFGGSDDYFSSDFADQELVERLKHVGQLSDRRVLVAFSGADEYVPQTIDTTRLLDRLVGAMNSQCSTERPVAIGLHLPRANHNLSLTPEDSETFVQALANLLRDACNPH